MDLTIDLIVLYIFGIVLGIFIGLQIARTMKPKTIGNLRLDHSDPDQPYLFLEFTQSPELLHNQKEVILKVKIEDYIPHK